MSFQWKENTAVSACELCNKIFTFVFRKHHCRACGGIFCGQCSKNRLILNQPILPSYENDSLPAKEHRVCDSCFEKTKDHNICPVCARQFKHENDLEIENHVKECLESGKFPSARIRMYRLNPNSSLIGQECTICYETYKAEEEMAVCVCLCNFHFRCLARWFDLGGKGCPIHFEILKNSSNTR